MVVAYVFTWFRSGHHLENQSTAKGNWPTSDNSEWYLARPRVGVLARSCCISQNSQADFEQMLKLLMNLLIFSIVNTFSWRRHSMITVSPNEQNPSLVCTYLISIAFFHPSNVQNFASIPTSSNQLHKCHKKMFSWIFPMAPQYIHMVSRFQLSKLYSRFRQLVFVFKPIRKYWFCWMLHNSTKCWHLSCHKYHCRNLSALKGIQKSGLITEIAI